MDEIENRIARLEQEAQEAKARLFTCEAVLMTFMRRVVPKLDQARTRTFYEGLHTDAKLILAQMDLGSQEEAATVSQGVADTIDRMSAAMAELADEDRPKPSV